MANIKETSNKQFLELIKMGLKPNTKTNNLYRLINNFFVANDELNAFVKKCFDEKTEKTSLEFYEQIYSINNNNGQNMRFRIDLLKPIICELVVELNSEGRNYSIEYSIDYYGTVSLIEEELHQYDEIFMQIFEYIRENQIIEKISRIVSTSLSNSQENSSSLDFHYEMTFGKYAKFTVEFPFVQYDESYKTSFEIFKNPYGWSENIININSEKFPNNPLFEHFIRVLSENTTAKNILLSLDISNSLKDLPNCIYDQSIWYRPLTLGDFSLEDKVEQVILMKINDEYVNITPYVKTINDINDMYIITLTSGVNMRVSASEIILLTSNNILEPIKVPRKNPSQNVDILKLIKGEK